MVMMGLFSCVSCGCENGVVSGLVSSYLQFALFRCIKCFVRVACRMS